MSAEAARKAEPFKHGGTMKPAEQCSDVIVTRFKEKADFVVLLEHEGERHLQQR